MFVNEADRMAYFMSDHARQSPVIDRHVKRLGAADHSDFRAAYIVRAAALVPGALRHQYVIGLIGPSDAADARRVQ